MTIDPTREEWLEARERRDQLCATYAFSESLADQIMTTILGPCPPEPAPEPFRLGDYTLVRLSAIIGQIAVPRHQLTPDEAFAMGRALIKHARYAREQAPDGLGVSPLKTPGDGIPPSELKAEALVDPPACGLVCQRPKGHEGVCKGEEPEVCGHLVADEDVEDGKERCERPRGHGGRCLPRRALIDDIWRTAICGRVLDRKPSETSAMVCQRPKGHAGACEASA